MFQRSAQAPAIWDEAATEALVGQVVRALGPDIVTYQELPGLVPFVETHSMIKANPRTHSGNLATLVAHHLMEPEPGVAVAERCGILTTFGALDLTVANIHLAPGKAMADHRLAQLEAIVNGTTTEHLFIVGDTNTRLAEIESIEALGLRSDNPPSPTWDSRTNRFRSAAPEFSAYFTRWFATPGIEVTDVKVHREPTDHGGQPFYVSDHFAMSGRITIED